MAFLDRASQVPVVIKADGLAAGKGVVIAEDRERARRAVQRIYGVEHTGRRRIENCHRRVHGRRRGLFSRFRGWDSVPPMVLAQDHKRRFDGDAGPNTGGMGAYSIDTILSSQQQLEVIERIVRPTLAQRKSYSGILYAGLMMTEDGPKVVEYNARFGDPETQVILPRLKTDLLSVLIDMAEHHLGSRKLEWHADVTATVVLVVGRLSREGRSRQRNPWIDGSGRASKG